MLFKVLRFFGWCIVVVSFYVATRSLAEIVMTPTPESLIRFVFWAVMTIGITGLLFVRRKLDTDSWRLPVLIVLFLVVAVLNLLAVLGSHMAQTGIRFGSVTQQQTEPTPEEPAQDLPLNTISAEDVVVDVNKRRVAVGLEPLAVNPLLLTSACSKTDDMIAKNYWGHDSPDGTEPWYWIKLAGYSYKVAGENLAYGYATSDAMVEGWMNSQTHKDNILNATYEETGVCIKRASTFQGGMDQLVATQHFGTR